MALTRLTVTRHESHFQFILHPPGEGATAIAGTSHLPSEQLDQLLVAMQSLAEETPGNPTHETQLSQLGQAFFRLLVPANIGRYLRGSDDPLYISCNDSRLPWEVFHDGSEFLSLRSSMSRMMVSDDLRGMLDPRPTSSADPAFLIIADPLDDSPAAAAEGFALADLFEKYGRCDVLHGTEATFSEISRHLVRRYSVIHYCGHIEYSPYSKPNSGIRLSDGTVLHPAAVQGLFKGSPLVFLNGCYSNTPPNAESRSAPNFFAQAFLVGNEQGLARAVVGTMWAVLDDSVQEFAKSFYRAALDGAPIGEAMRSCRVAAKEQELGPMHWGSYVLYGDPSQQAFETIPQPLAVSGADEVELSSTDGAGTERSSEELGESLVVAPSPVKTRFLPADLDSEPQQDDEADGGRDEGEIDGVLNDTTREVLLAALNVQVRWEHSALSSIHLLIGMCSSDELLRTSPLARVLDQANVPREAILSGAFEVADEVFLGGSERAAFTKGVGRSFRRGLRLANSASRDLVTCSDLFYGMCGTQESLARLALGAMKIGGAEIDAAIQESVILGPVDIFAASASVSEAVAEAVRSSRSLGLPYVGSPQLLVGLLRSAAPSTLRAFGAHRVNVDRLAEALESVAVEERPSAPVLHPTRATRGICLKALESARESGAESVGPDHVLAAILEGESSATQVLDVLDLDRPRMLESLREPPPEKPE